MFVLVLELSDVENDRAHGVKAMLMMYVTWLNLESLKILTVIDSIDICLEEEEEEETDKRFAYRIFPTDYNEDFD